MNAPVPLTPEQVELLSFDLSASAWRIVAMGGVGAAKRHIRRQVDAGVILLPGYDPEIVDAMVDIAASLDTPADAEAIAVAAHAALTHSQALSARLDRCAQASRATPEAIAHRWAKAIASPRSMAAPAEPVPAPRPVEHHQLPEPAKPVAVQPPPANAQGAPAPAANWRQRLAPRKFKQYLALAVGFAAAGVYAQFREPTMPSRYLHPNPPELEQPAAPGVSDAPEQQAPLASTQATATGGEQSAPEPATDAP